MYADHFLVFEGYILVIYIIGCVEIGNHKEEILVSLKKCIKDI